MSRGSTLRGPGGRYAGSTRGARHVPTATAHANGNTAVVSNEDDEANSVDDAYALFTAGASREPVPLIVRNSREMWSVLREPGIAVVFTQSSQAPILGQPITVTSVNQRTREFGTELRQWPDKPDSPYVPQLPEKEDLDFNPAHGTVASREKPVAFAVFRGGIPEAEQWVAANTKMLEHEESLRQQRHRTITSSDDAELRSAASSDDETTRTYVLINKRSPDDAVDHLATEFPERASGHPNCSSDTLRKIVSVAAASPNPENVIYNVVRHPNASDALLEEIATSYPAAAAAGPRASSETLAKLASHPDPYVRQLVIENPNASEEVKVMAALMGSH